ncbi:hypothetical protein RQP46_005607 [Phenoliferia psychrophenolica]
MLQMSVPLSRLSLSSTFSFSDPSSSSIDHFDHSPIHSYGPPSTADDDYDPHSHSRSHSTASTTTIPGSRRSRARRLSVLLSPSLYPSPTPGVSDVFAEREYEDALKHEEEGLELDALGIDDQGETGGGIKYASTFQPLTREELAWMGVSAVVVLALTAVACVFTAVG